MEKWTHRQAAKARKEAVPNLRTETAGSFADVPSKLGEVCPVGRLDQQMDRFRRLEEMPLPEDLDYRSLGSLSNEVVERLEQSRPANLGQASRLPGLTPAAITHLMMHLRRTDAA